MDVDYFPIISSRSFYGKAGKKIFPEEYQAIDEQIVALKGRLGLKQYLQKKPKKWGVKIWVRAGVSGYMYRFEIYQGSGVEGNDDIGFCNHKIFFDNLFCSIPLLEILKKKQIWATGTIRSNRLEGAELILHSNEIMKKGRGSTCVASTGCGTATVTKWMDNKPVHVASNCAGSKPENSTKR
ncbi:hypothetical protein NQ317_000523 [Molorchus minor]|uniref:PiggyBac transposable element-derived protein domain-containing protein n=1 Tax=Molorchus minor TaxID=1323400 RepID=A0ABQ9J9D7_9CUCU|nr:hypothetical protein NQ317_000523 [Molorchus minor]